MNKEFIIKMVLSELKTNEPLRLELKKLLEK